MPLSPATRVAASPVASWHDAVQTAQPANLNSADVAASWLGPWRLETVLAEGRWSRVYRAWRADAGDDKGTNRPANYAVKVLDDRYHDHPVALSRLRNEATVGRCVAHRHIVPVLAAHVGRPPYYTVMPLLRGANVEAHLAARQRFDVPTALWIARQAAEGLAGLHTAGYVHGDVKPANIFVAPQGHVTLLDLGCARRIEPEPTLDDGPLPGTPEFLAPELLVGKGPTAASDLYSLGMTLFQMLAGRLPWRGGDLGVIAGWKRSGQHAEVREFAPHVPVAVSRLVRQLTACEPLRRPLSAREAAEMLVRLEIETLRERLPA